MNPMSTITFPQLVAEMVFFNRSTYIKTYPKIQKGSGWTKGIESQYRSVIQQCYNLCNYFPKADDNKLVELSFRNFFRNNRCMAIGAYRKTRLTKNNKINISQAEKDVIKGITYELEKLENNNRKICFSPVEPEEIIVLPEVTKINNIIPVNRKISRFEKFLNIEKNIENKDE